MEKQSEIFKLLKGTTTVGMCFKDYVVLAADRRATSGYFISHKKAKKIHKIDEHIATTIAGYVGDAQFIVERLSTEARLYRLQNNEPIGVDSIATLASTVLFYNRPLLIAQLLIGGVDHEGAKLFSIDWLGTVTKEKYTASGSGTPYAVSIIEENYDPSLNSEEALKIAVRAVRAALLRDPGSGEGVDVAIINKNGINILRGEDIHL